MDRQPVPPGDARAWHQVDLDAVRRNARRIAAHCGTRLTPVLKADAYGLGAVAVARALEGESPWGFAVATVAEGIALREAGLGQRILVCPPVLPPEFAAAAAARLTLALSRPDHVDGWLGAGGRAWHLSIDTGMSRAGVRWDEIGTMADAVGRNAPEGIFTHFLAAERGDASMVVQEERFRNALAALPATTALLHAENSAAAARHANSRYDLIRPGIFLFGVGSGPGAGVTPDPVAAVRSRVTDLRRVERGESVSYDASWVAHGPRRVATVALGYADGYRRALGNRAHMLLHGRRVSVIGHVTMDMTMLDVTDVPCELGDVVTVLGSDGDEHVTAEELAELVPCSTYEILTGFQPRLVRRYEGATA